jgi:hypothetical protein
MTRLRDSPSAENKHPTPIGQPHFGRRRAILTSDKRAFRTPRDYGPQQVADSRSLPRELASDGVVNHAHGCSLITVYCLVRPRPFSCPWVGQGAMPSLKSEYTVRAWPGGFLGTNPKKNDETNPI